MIRPACFFLGASLALTLLCPSSAFSEQLPTALPQVSPASDPVVATVDGEAILLSELDASIAGEIYALQQRIHQMRSRALDALIASKLFEKEARHRRLTPPLLRQAIVDSVVLDEEQVAARAAGGDIQARERVRAMLESEQRVRLLEEAVAGMRSRANVVVLLEKPAAPTILVSDRGPSRGADNAAVTIIEFADFECAYCRRAHETLKQILSEYSDSVRLVFKHLPLPNHSRALPAAQAAVCADQAGRFWPYHDRLFEDPGNLSETDLLRHATALGLDADRFRGCLNSERSRAIVMRDLAEARKAGIGSTPAFLVNGVLVRGAVPLDAFKETIDRALADRRDSTKR